MSKINKANSFTNVLIISFAAMFGVVALALGYAAMNSDTDLRSKAAEEQTIYKQWEFNNINNSNAEGWVINKPLSFVTKFGWLSFTPQKDASLASISHSQVGASMPKGNKYVVFSVSAGTTGKASPTPMGCPRPPICADAQATVDTSVPKRAGCPVYKCLPIVRTSTPSVQRGGFGGWVQGESVEVVDEAAVYREAVRQKIACPMEAKVCPDGSSVGRSGRSCGFLPCQTKRVLSGNIYYTFITNDMTDKRKGVPLKMEKPIEFTASIDGSFQEVKALLPVINEATIQTLRIEFTSGLKPGEAVNMDWIRLIGVVDKKLPPTPSIARCIPVGECPEGAECVKAALPPGAEYCKPTPKPSISPRTCRIVQEICDSAPCPETRVCDPVVTTIAPGEAFTCPASGWVDCMPSTNSNKFSGSRSLCTDEYLNWALKNCEGFKGAAR